jgi:hypothetical protein
MVGALTCLNADHRRCGDPSLQTADAGRSTMAIAEQATAKSVVVPTQHRRGFKNWGWLLVIAALVAAFFAMLEILIFAVILWITEAVDLAFSGFANTTEALIFFSNLRS